MKLNIYNIQREYQELAEIIIDNGGEVTEELETALAINQEELQLKAAQFGLIIKDTDLEISAIDTEIERLTAMKKSRSNMSTRLKETIKSAMEIYGIEEIKTETLKIGFRKSTSVEIEDESLIPDFYKEQVVTEKISKKEIGDTLKAGQAVPGAYLKQNKNIQIK